MFLRKKRGSGLEKLKGDSRVALRRSSNRYSFVKISKIQEMGMEKIKLPTGQEIRPIYSSASVRSPRLQSQISLVVFAIAVAIWTAISVCAGMQTWINQAPARPRRRHVRLHSVGGEDLERNKKDEPPMMDGKLP